MPRKNLPPMYNSWRQLYDDVISKGLPPNARKIVFKWMLAPNYRSREEYERMLNKEPDYYEFSIYMDSLKKLCFEEMLEIEKKKCNLFRNTYV